MQVANEEMQSANEELQSTNEELETAKEELQSANEELTTLNDELGVRNTELTLLINDLNNLSSGVDLPVVMLDKNLRVRRFSAKAAEMFKLEDGKIGERIDILVRSCLSCRSWPRGSCEGGRGLKRKSCERTATIIRCASDLI